MPTEQDSSMAQSQKEESLEFDSLVRALHLPLKRWYTNLDECDELRKECGEYPMFARDLKVWPFFDKVRKAHMRHKFQENHPSKTEEKKTNLTEDPKKESSTNAQQPDPSTIANAPTRKRSRWNESKESSEDKIEGETSGETTDRKRKSRWGDSNANTAVTSSGGGDSSLTQHQAILLRLKIDEVNRRLLTVAYDAKMEEKNPNRSPSPPPKYDSNGKRTNTLEARMREKLEHEKQELSHQLLMLNPTMRAAGSRMQKLKRKIYIPVKDFPNYNFIGLIIGPRGLTQKRLEGESGASISIRGRGSVKEGRGRYQKKDNQNDQDDDLHVLIQGNTADAVDKASALVEDLLRPLDDSMNEHKQKQLRELALINGTLREEVHCTNCGEAGHRHWECPKAEAARHYKHHIKCAICGDGSHPTSDCPEKAKNDNSQSASAQKRLDSDFSQFMEELGGGATSKPRAQEVSTTNESKVTITPVPVPAPVHLKPPAPSTIPGGYMAPGTFSTMPPPGFLMPPPPPGFSMPPPGFPMHGATGMRPPPGFPPMPVPPGFMPSGFTPPPPPGMPPLPSAPPLPTAPALPKAPPPPPR